MFERLKQWLPWRSGDADLQARLNELRSRTPAPVFWLFGKTQSGKTSIIKYLTGAEDAEIGQGFRPCTRFSRLYEFPSAQAPLLRFLDTRGIDEPGYDPAVDLAEFGEKAHVVLVTARVLDHAQENVIGPLRRVRAARPSRPVVLALTCLHEAYPQQQHLQPYPFAERAAGLAPTDREGHTAGTSPAARSVVPENLLRALNEHEQHFAGLVDHVVPIDLTPPEEGFAEPDYGGERLKEVLLEVLPEAYRQTLLSLDAATRELKDLFARRALPHIIGYSSLAAGVGAFPIPGVDLFILPAIQTQMIHHLARVYGQPLTGKRFLELTSTLGLGMLVRTAARQVAKLIPVVGSMVGSAMAGASTFALGKAFCYYYHAVHEGHVPRAEDLRAYYEEQLVEARRLWGANRRAAESKA